MNKEVKRLLVVFYILLACTMVSLILIGCKTQNTKTYDRLFRDDGIIEQYKNYVKNDNLLTTEQKQRRLVSVKNIKTNLKYYKEDRSE